MLLQCVFYLLLLICHTSIIMLRNGNHKSQQSSTLAMTRLLQSVRWKIGWGMGMGMYIANI